MNKRWVVFGEDHDGDHEVKVVTLGVYKTVQDAAKASGLKSVFEVHLVEMSWKQTTSYEHMPVL